MSFEISSFSNDLIIKIRAKLDSATSQLNGTIAKDDLQDSIFGLEDIDILIGELQNDLYKTLLEVDPDNPMVLLMCSEFLVRSKRPLIDAFELAQRSIDIISRNSETISAVSKNFISLAFRTNNIALAKLEYERIGKLIELDEKLKYYLTSDLEHNQKQQLGII